MAVLERYAALRCLLHGVRVVGRSNRQVVALCRPRSAPTRPRLCRDAGSSVGVSTTGCWADQCAGAAGTCAWTSAGDPPSRLVSRNHASLPPLPAGLAFELHHSMRVLHSRATTGGRQLRKCTLPGDAPSAAHDHCTTAPHGGVARRLPQHDRSWPCCSFTGHVP
jgi:hypothetical protein